MITLTKNKLEILFLTVRGTEGVLSLSDSRTRDAFLKPLLEATKTFEEDRKAIYEKFCTKNEDGTPDLTDDKYHFEPEILEDLNKELTILYTEEVELPVAQNDALKSILESTEYKPKVNEVEIIDEILALL